MTTHWKITTWLFVATVALYAVVNGIQTAEIKALNTRIDYLHTERGFNELKCKAAGGELVEESSSGWTRTFNKEKGEWDEGKAISNYKRGCFSQLHEVSDVEIKI